VDKKIQEKINQLLTWGLKAGFAGKSKFETNQRFGFDMTASTFIPNNNCLYHDEWLADLNGGGQELVKTDGAVFTRLYGGGVIKEADLKKTGINKTDIMQFLKKIIIDHGNKIRLFNNYKYNENEWNYEYKIIDQEKNINLTTGKESIFYKNNLIFVHIFILSPVI